MASEFKYTPPGEIRNAKKRAFLVAYARCGGLMASCEAAKVHNSTVYNWRDKDPEFRDAWDDANECYIERLEAEADRRAVEGTQRLKFHQGLAVKDPRTKKPYVEREYSDNLLMFRLKAKRPELYRERSEVKMEVSEAEIDKLIEDEFERRSGATDDRIRHAEGNGELHGHE